MLLSQFFMKATQLEQMKEDYTYIMETKTVTQSTVEKHQSVSVSGAQHIQGFCCDLINIKNIAIQYTMVDLLPE